jgi:hypothetical protein
VTTAATANYLIERIGPRVDLCESQGDAWVTIRRNISRATAARYGFNLDAPAVRKVFDPQPAFVPGSTVLCLDATHGAHFLYVGRRYVVESTQTDDAGKLRLNLRGMARAWEAERFQPA